MKTLDIKKYAIAITALFILAISFSSCNRGYGCPYELKNAIKVIGSSVK